MLPEKQPGYTKAQKKAFYKAVKELIDNAQPAEWNSFFFQLQTDMIRLNYFEGYTKAGLEEHTAKFNGLKTFFDTLNEI